MMHKAPNFRIIENSNERHPIAKQSKLKQMRNSYILKVKGKILDQLIGTTEEII